MNVVGNPVKNMFSKAALRMLNACGRFVWNFAQGFGIKLRRTNGSVVVEIDKGSTVFQKWIRSLVDLLQENRVDQTTLGKPYDISDPISLSLKAPAQTLPKLVPAGITDNEDTETVEDAIARIGRSSRAAREDHRHLLLGSTMLPKADAGEGASGFYVEVNGAMELSGDLRVALANHVHPLNIGTTEKTYAAGNHRHTDIEDAVDEAIDAANTAQQTANEAKQLAAAAGGGVSQTAFNQLQNTVMEQAESIDAISTQIEGISEKQAEDSEAMSQLQENVSGLEENMTAVESDVDTLNHNTLFNRQGITAILSDYYETFPNIEFDSEGLPSGFGGGVPKIPEALIESDNDVLKPAADEPSAGSSGKLVYSDHVHPEPTDDSQPTGLGSGAVSSSPDTVYAKDTASWAAGIQGVKILIATRTSNDGANGAIFFREATLDKFGRIRSISGETGYGLIVTVI